MVSDPIADMLTRIRNGYQASKLEVVMPYSKAEEAVALVLKKYKFLQDVKVQERNKKKFLSVYLRYKNLPRSARQNLDFSENKNLPRSTRQNLDFSPALGSKKGKPAISHIVRISKPGCRVYKKAKELPRVLDGFGICIVSTPKGVMAGNEAKKKNLGGEVLCEVW